MLITCLLTYNVRFVETVLVGLIPLLFEKTIKTEFYTLLYYSYSRVSESDYNTFLIYTVYT